MNPDRDRFAPRVTPWRCWLFAALAIPAPLQAQPPDPGHDSATAVAHAARLAGAIHVDGVPDEPAWSAAEPVTAFTQRDPEEGQPVSERTEVRILIGEDAIYIGARLYDRDA